MLTAFGATAVTFMMVMYAFERRHPRFILAFRLWLRTLKRLRVPRGNMAVRGGGGHLGRDRPPALP